MNFFVKLFILSTTVFVISCAKKSSLTTLETASGNVENAGSNIGNPNSGVSVSGTPGSASQSNTQSMTSQSQVAGATLSNATVQAASSSSASQLGTSNPYVNAVSNGAVVNVAAQSPHWTTSPWTSSKYNCVSERHVIQKRQASCLNNGGYVQPSLAAQICTGAKPAESQMVEDLSVCKDYIGFFPSMVDSVNPEHCRGGTGKVDDPMVICTPNDFISVAGAGFTKVIKDLDFSSSPSLKWAVGIGNSTFDGQGHSFSNLKMETNPMFPQMGLFHIIDGGVLKNLTLINTQGTFAVGSGSILGDTAVSWSSSALVDNVHVQNAVVNIASDLGHGIIAGGLFAITGANTSITNSSFEGAINITNTNSRVEGMNAVGGLVGVSLGGALNPINITNCESRAQIDATLGTQQTPIMTGGLIGWSGGLSNITQSRVFGSLKMPSGSYVGRVLGENINGGFVRSAADRAAVAATINNLHLAMNANSPSLISDVNTSALNIVGNVHSSPTLAYCGDGGWGDVESFRCGFHYE